MDPDHLPALGLLHHRVSSLDHILQTNNPPSDDEIDQIQYLLHDIERFFTQKHGERCDSDEYRLLKASHKACQSAMSSFRRLPAEILLNIFSLVALPQLDIGGYCSSNFLDITQEPWTLTHVNSSWRAITLSHREIWSQIRINLGALSRKYKLEPPLVMLLCALQRSSNHSLSIDFTDNFLLGTLWPSGSRAPELLNALLQHSPRWVDVKFTMEYKNFPLLTQAREHLPLLHSLEVYGYGRKMFDILRAFEVAPSLREVSIGLDAPYTLVLPWLQLTKVQSWLIPVPTVTYWAPLDQTWNVEDFSLTIAFDQLPPWMSMPVEPPRSVRDILQHDRMLRLQINSELALNGLSAPALEVLHIFSHQEESSLEYVTSFLRRSSCSLQSLLLTNATIHSSLDLMPLLQSAPSLTFLQVKLGQPNWRILFALLTVKDDQCLLPILTTLRVYFGTDISLSCALPGIPEYAVDMVLSRLAGREGVHCLESIALLELPRPLSSQFLTALVKLEELGLNVAHDLRPGDIPQVSLWASEFQGYSSWRPGLFWNDIPTLPSHN
ncbi:hypothetical protein Hypma_013769 [Hypsizygus marmoreus]|uniref:Uncharacterized protein n=1 Tax=Hypsizygus marmoreus TaxID=39966 RepID=A0A369KDC2_HYPMA|nr:hypothetical protein Hypma_013769 [Hypsizygus marmoreus]